MQWLAKISVQRPVFAAVIILALCVTGIYSFFQLGLDQNPNVDIPTITVTTTLAGTSAEEMDTAVTEEIEKQVNTISGIDNISSVSSEGISTVTIAFLLNKSSDIAFTEVQAKVNLAIPNLPTGIDQPSIQKFSTDSTPIINFTLTAPGETIRNLSEYADKTLRPQLESLNGVGEASIVGGRLRQINVTLDPNRLRAYDLNPVAVRTAISTQNVDLPSGAMEHGATRVSVRTEGRFSSVAALQSMVVAQHDGQSVFLRDVADVEDSQKEAETVARLNGKQSVLVQIKKQNGANTIQVINDVKERLAELTPRLPSGYKIQITSDNSIFIEASVHTVEEHLMLGSLLAVLVVLFFLRDWRSTLISALAIPSSIIATFTFMWAMGFTLNTITLLAFTLCVGIVIDDAILVLENIYRFMTEKNMSPKQAAVEATNEIGLAVLATTLSLIAIFLPVGFMSGILGRFMSSFGLTMAFAIFISLIVAFTLTPMLSSRWLSNPNEGKDRADKDQRKDQTKDQGTPEASATGEAQHTGDATAPTQNGDGKPQAGNTTTPTQNGDGKPQAGSDTTAPTQDENGKPQARTQIVHGEEEPAAEADKKGLYHVIETVYWRILRWSLHHRWVIVALCILVLLSSVPLLMKVNKEFIPSDDQSEFLVSVRTPEGFSLTATGDLLQQIATDIRKLPDIKYTVVTVGSDAQKTVNKGDITVRMQEIADRKGKDNEFQMMERVRREILPRYPKDLRVSVTAASPFGSGPMPSITYIISGPEMNVLNAASTKLVAKIKQIPGVSDVDSTATSGNPELQLKIKRREAADLGISANDLATTEQIAIAGLKVSNYSEGGRLYDINLRAKPEYREGRQDLSLFTVPSTNSGLAVVPFDQLVTYTDTTASTSINRYQRQRQITFSVNIATGASQQTIQTEIDKAYHDLNLGPQYQGQFGSFSKELGKSFVSFATVLVLAFTFIYLILSAQFESWIHPFTILVSLPLSIPFALFSLLLTGTSLNLYSMLGILVLFGVVKKNSILQVDHANQLREQGMARDEAVLHSSRDRLRPILMTTIAFVAGMLPLAFANGVGATTNRSAGDIIIGGQTLSLALTLVATPVIYTLMDDLTLAIARTKTRVSNLLQRHPAPVKES
jgi:hydrophobic/amphiphilic exporter-1 (mainly G- bacteria), HAE1 family